MRFVAAALSAPLVFAAGCTSTEPERATPTVQCLRSTPAWVAGNELSFVASGSDAGWRDDTILVVRRCGVALDFDENVVAVPRGSSDPLRLALATSNETPAGPYTDMYFVLTGTGAAQATQFEVAGARLDFSDQVPQSVECSAASIKAADVELERCGAATRLVWRLDAPKAFKNRVKVAEVDVKPLARATDLPQPASLKTSVRATSEGVELVVDLTRNAWLRQRCVRLVISHADFGAASVPPSVSKWLESQETEEVCRID